MSVDGCPFCRRIAASDYDFIGPSVVGFVPLNPVTDGHYLILPRRHVETFHDAPEMFSIVARSAARRVQRLRGEGYAEDFNLIVSAGPTATQTVPHLHLHVVPRRAGDGLTLPWTGQTR